MTFSDMPARRFEVIAGLLLCALLWLAWYILSHGCAGNFIFDDSWNLRGLAQIDRNPTLEQGLQYVINGIAGQFGRPLALASFAVQYMSWPWHPSDFSRVNVLLHVLNGALLFWMLVRLTRLLGTTRERGFALAFLVTALWLLAPLQASAVLYIVQRMAVMAGTFAILGTLIYLCGRQRLEDGRVTSGLAWMTAAVGVGAGVGVLAKENAALVPLALLVLEVTLLSSLRRGALWWRWAAVCLVLPTVLLAGALVYKIPDILRDFGLRDFTMGERLLTESRVLFIYLQKLLLPSLYSIRLLYDDLAVSRGLLSPATTLLSLAAWAVLIASAVKFRRRAPVFSFAVLWFLTHHLLESTFIPLELAFEHRNYVAAIGPLFALVWYAQALMQWPPAQRLRYATAASLAALLCFQAVALLQSAKLWANARDLSYYWATTQPDSIRARMQFADSFLWVGDYGRAVAVFEEAMKRWPGDPAIPLAIMGVGCLDSEAPVPSNEEIHRTIDRFKGSVLSTINIFDRILTDMELGLCHRYPPSQLRALVDHVAARPEFRHQTRNIVLMRSRLAELEGDRSRAMEYLDEAIRMSPVLPLLTQGVVWALQAGDVDRARHYVALAEQIAAYSWRGWSQRGRAEELRRIMEQYVRDHTEGGGPDAGKLETGGH